ncbi:MAG: IclR family transcriptional regulator [Alphaproteobacteria bacterium]|nr:IclR family transcriptional regulator [Alphaproteobacteria bacterium]
MNSSVKSASRILDILELFALGREPMRLSDISDQLGIPKSSSLMLLRTLEARGYLVREGERYRLEPSFDDDRREGFWIGGRLAQLVRIAEPVMADMVETLQETAVLGIPTPEHNVRVVANRLSPLAIRYDLTRMTVIPAYCTALGQAMLAFQPEEAVASYIRQCSFEALTEKTITDPEQLRQRLALIRRHGWAVNYEERFIGAAGTASPIFDATGRVVAALNVATVTVRFRRNKKLIVETVQREAARLSEALGAGRLDAGRVTTATVREAKA